MNAKPQTTRLARRAGIISLTKSEQMARVRSANTDAEMLLRRALWRDGLRFRVTYRSLPGSPDLVFTRWRLAIFVDGCFWHGCPIHYTSPISNSTYWREKNARNRARDARADAALEVMGWTVLRVWEHDIYDSAALPSVIKRIHETLTAAGKPERRTLPIQR